MLSDIWLRAGYSTGERVKCDEYVDYRVWYDTEKNPIGITVDFEFANDYHIEMTAENINRFMSEVVGEGCFPNELEPLAMYIADNRAEFEGNLDKNGIKYSSIHYY